MNESATPYPGLFWQPHSLCREEIRGGQPSIDRSSPAGALIDDVIAATTGLHECRDMHRRGHASDGALRSAQAKFDTVRRNAVLSLESREADLRRERNVLVAAMAGTVIEGGKAETASTQTGEAA